MKKGIVLLVILIIFIISSITNLLIYNYLDPYENLKLAIGLFSFSIFMSCVSSRLHS